MDQTLFSKWAADWPEAARALLPILAEDIDDKDNDIEAVGHLEWVEEGIKKGLG